MSGSTESNRPTSGRSTHKSAKLLTTATDGRFGRGRAQISRWIFQSHGGFFKSHAGFSWPHVAFLIVSRWIFQSHAGFFKSHAGFAWGLGGVGRRSGRPRQTGPERVSRPARTDLRLMDLEVPGQPGQAGRPALGPGLGEGRRPRELTDLSRKVTVPS